MKKYRFFKILYRICVYGTKTTWNTLRLEKPYNNPITAPDLLSAVHWRMTDIAESVEKLESTVAKVCDLRIVEILPLEGYMEHLSVCSACMNGNDCFKGEELKNYDQK